MAVSSNNNPPRPVASDLSCRQQQQLFGSLTRLAGNQRPSKLLRYHGQRQREVQEYTQEGCTVLSVNFGGLGLEQQIVMKKIGLDGKARQHQAFFVTRRFGQGRGWSAGSLMYQQALLRGSQKKKTPLNSRVCCFFSRKLSGHSLQTICAPLCLVRSTKKCLQPTSFNMSTSLFNLVSESPTRSVALRHPEKNSRISTGSQLTRTPEVSGPELLRGFAQNREKREFSSAPSL